MTTFLRSPEYRKQLHKSFLTNKAAVRKQIAGVTATSGAHEPALQIISPTVSTVILPGVQAGSVAGNAVITVTGGDPAFAVFDEDFSSYTDSANWRTDPNSWYDAIPSSAVQFIDTSITDPEVTTSSQSLRVEFLPGICGGLTAGFNITQWQDGRILADISPDLTEVWIEMRVRFDSAWNTNDTNSCAEPEAHELLRAHVGTQGQTPYFQLNDGVGSTSLWQIGAPPDNLGQAQVATSTESLSASDNTWHVVRMRCSLSTNDSTPDGLLFVLFDGKRLIGTDGFTGDDIITTSVDPGGTGETYNNFTKIQFLGELKPLKATPTQKLWISRVRVFDQDQNWSVDFPNEPAGHTLISERGFSAFLEDGWGNNGSGGNYQVGITDAGALISPTDVGQARYPTGFTGGVATHSTFRSFTGTDIVYVAFPIKYSANWEGHQSGVNKILFVTASDYGGGGAPLALSAQGVDANPLNFQIRLQGPGDESSASAGSNIGFNLVSATLTRDVWYNIEILFTANTGTNFDGKLDVWIDNVKTHQYTDVKYFDDTADPSNHKWTNVKWNPTWGGTGDTVTATQHHWIDHIRISGP